MTKILKTARVHRPPPSSPHHALAHNVSAHHNPSAGNPHNTPWPLHFPLSALPSLKLSPLPPSPLLLHISSAPTIHPFPPQRRYLRVHAPRLNPPCFRVLRHCLDSPCCEQSTRHACCEIRPVVHGCEVCDWSVGGADFDCGYWVAR